MLENRFGLTVTLMAQFGRPYRGFYEDSLMALYIYIYSEIKAKCHFVNCANDAFYYLKYISELGISLFLFDVRRCHILCRSKFDMKIKFLSLY